MEQTQHFVQDACEIYAVAVLQQQAEAAGLAWTQDAEQKLQDFYDYANERGLTQADFDRWPEYLANVEYHMPLFFADLVDVLGASPMDFIDVERAYRNLNLKGDFVISRPDEPDISVSLKNYCNSASRTQCSSGTFNSFPLNFIFDSAGVGMFLDPTGNRFKGSTVSKRDAALIELGRPEIVPLMLALDELNAAIKQRFVYGEEFAFLDEAQFDLARKQIGAAGQEIILEILESLGDHQVKARLLKMTSLDGQEEVLIMDPAQRSDTITNPKFRKLRFGVSSDECVVHFASHEQSIRFEFVMRGEVLLVVDVPFTINKNGAWISETYEGEGTAEGSVVNVGL